MEDGEVKASKGRAAAALELRVWWLALEVVFSTVLVPFYFSFDCEVSKESPS